MAIKETIAFVGTSNNKCTVLANRLALGNYRLLFLSNEEEQFAALYEQLLQQSPLAEIETVDCIKNGCWEADIIILTDVAIHEQALIEKIKEVATQKIVILMPQYTNESSITNEINRLQQALPNSKVVGLFYKATSAEAFISGDDKEAIATIANMLEIKPFTH